MQETRFRISSSQRNWQLDLDKFHPHAEFEQGGSHSGGGQGVYDRKTQRVRFLDIMNETDFKNLDPSIDPVRDVFSKFSTCTKYTNYPFNPEFATGRMGAIGKKYVEKISRLRSLPALSKVESPSIFYVTSLALYQLRDNQRFSPAYQIQAAYYTNGRIYLQKQVLDLLPDDDVVGLLIKETMLR